MIAGLFDLDGVVLNTEDQYGVFWSEQGQLYRLGINGFDRHIKGWTTKRILGEYFPNPDLQEEIKQSLSDFEQRMKFPFVAGVEEFVADLREHHVPVAVVTSSDDAKMSIVHRERPELKNMFDLFITADKIHRSKPDPECYLLAARELGAKPEYCYVFEDSFSGLESGRSAGMNVIGIATTNPVETIRDKANWVMPDFRGFGYEKLLSIKKS